MFTDTFKALCPNKGWWVLGTAAMETHQHCSQLAGMMGWMELQTGTVSETLACTWGWKRLFPQCKSLCNARLDVVLSMPVQQRQLVSKVCEVTDGG